MLEPAAGIFARACQAIGGDQSSNTAVKRESVLQEAAALTESLTDKLISLKISQGAGIGENLPSPPPLLSKLLYSQCIVNTLLQNMLTSAKKGD